MSRPRSPTADRGRPPLRPRDPKDVHVTDVMTSLRAGLPISLLLDLAAVDGPDSACILATEAPDGDGDWISLPTPRAGTARRALGSTGGDRDPDLPPADVVRARARVGRPPRRPAPVAGP